MRNQRIKKTSASKIYIYTTKIPIKYASAILEHSQKVIYTNVGMKEKNIVCCGIDFFHKILNSVLNKINIHIYNLHYF